MTAASVIHKQYVEYRETGYWIIDSHISLDSVVYAFLKGTSPEGIVQSFPLCVFARNKKLRTPIQGVPKTSLFTITTINSENSFSKLFWYFLQMIFFPMERTNA